MGRRDYSCSDSEIFVFQKYPNGILIYFRRYYKSYVFYQAISMNWHRVFLFEYFMRRSVVLNLLHLLIYDKSAQMQDLKRPSEMQHRALTCLDCLHCFPCCHKKTKFYGIEHFHICHKYHMYFFPTGSRTPKAQFDKTQLFFSHPVPILLQQQKKNIVFSAYLIDFCDFPLFRIFHRSQVQAVTNPFQSAPKL